MRESPRERAGSQLSRLPKIGAWAASSALVLASLVALPAAADESPEPEETVTTAAATDAATAEQLADEQRKTRVVSDVDLESATASEEPPAPDESVEQTADPDTTETESAAEPTTTEPAQEPSADPEETPEAPAATSPDDAETAQEDAPAEAEDLELLQQDNADAETEVWLTPSSPRTQAQLETGTNQVLGTGFPANTAVSVTIDGQTVATGETLDNGGVNILYNTFLEPGTYTVTVTAGGLSDSTELVVTDGGYSLDVCVGESFECYFGTILHITAWDLSRAGALFAVDGFRPNEVVTLSVNGITASEVTVNDNGFASGTFTAELTPGTYALTATSSVGSASYDFVVVEESDDWSDYDDTPSVNVNRQFVTESWLQNNAITFELEDYPEDTSVDVYLDGEHLDTIAYEWRAEYELGQDLTVGDYTVEFRHPVGNVSIDIAVHPDEQGDPVFTGEWAGNAEQTGAGSYNWDELDIEDRPNNHTYPLTLHIDESGNLTSLSGEFWWVCIGVQTGYIDSGYSDLADSDIPTTALTIDRPFQIEWEGAGFDYRLIGVLNADGTASGTIRASLGACGASTLNWSTTFDGDVPEPSPEPTEEPTPDPTEEPTPDPTEEPTPDPTEEPTPDPTQEPTPEPTEEPTPDPTEEPTPDPTEEPTPDPTEEPTPDPTEEPTPDPTEEPTPDPTQEPTPEPTEEPTPEPSASETPSTPTDSTIPVDAPDADELDGNEGDGITVPETARAGDTLTVTVTGVADGTTVGAWLFSDPVYLGTHTVTDSAIQVTVPGDTDAGEHRIAVYSADGQLLGWDTIMITSGSPGASDGAETPSTAPEESAPAGGSGSGIGGDAIDNESTTGHSPTSADTGSALARSGASVTLITIGGLVLLAVGALLLVRRRNA